MTSLALSFNNINLTPVNHNNQIWLTSAELAKSLGYSQENAVTKIFNRCKDEFTENMSMIMPLTQTGSLGESSGLQREQRIFSLRGCHLLAMFSRTAIAKEFRKWVLDILDLQAQPQYALKELPPSPFISESEAAQFKKSLEAFGKGDRKIYSTLHRKAWEHYGITTYKNIPAGKLEEASRLCGFRLLKLDRSKIPEAQPVIDLPKESDTNSITINLAPLEHGKIRRWLVSQMRTEVTMLHSINPDEHLMTMDDAIDRLVKDGYIVVKKSDVINRLS